MLLPGTAKFPGEALHRPHPDRRQATICDRVLKGAPVLRQSTPGVRLCSRCEVAVRRSRMLVQAANARRASSAGLPGLGRRR